MDAATAGAHPPGQQGAYDVTAELALTDAQPAGADVVPRAGSSLRHATATLTPLSKTRLRHDQHAPGRPLLGVTTAPTRMTLRSSFDAMGPSPTSASRGRSPRQTRPTGTPFYAATRASVQRRTRKAAARLSGLSLIVLDLVRAFTAHAVQVIAGAGVLHPRVAAIGTVAQLAQASNSIPSSPAPLDEAAHWVSMPQVGRTIMPR